MHLFSLLFLVLMVVLLKEINSLDIADVSIQRVEQTAGYDLVKSALRVTKFNRTCAVVNGTLDYLVDLDNSFSVSILRDLRSASNKGQGVVHSFR